jgi:predicted enzyme related to lactoylglutathione lyase
MINYRVADLNAALAALGGEGVSVDERVEESAEGRFGWITDSEGNRIELWQPPPGR